MSTPSERREAIVSLVLAPWGFLRSSEPMFKVWDRIPVATRQMLSELKSDDIKDDVWHLWRGW